MARSRESARHGPNVEGRFAYEGLERVIHEKARLGILTSLITRPEGLLFNDLKELCSLTDGNLSRHLAVLTEAGLVEVWRGGRGRRTQTRYMLTAAGKRRFLEYINVLESVVADAVAARLSRPDTPPPAQAAPLRQGWSTM